MKILNKIIFLLLFCLCLNLKFFYKRKSKTLQDDTFNVPQVPELSKYIYPSLQYYLSKNTHYNDIIPSEDLAQIETKIGLISPTNILFDKKARLSILKDALMVKDK